MSQNTFAGSRIRERRIDRGLRQADVAVAAGISASYLNLIEHNKRRIGGKLLTTLAEILDVPPDTLSAGADTMVLDGMRSAASRLGIDVELDRVEDMAVRLPGWAKLIAAQNDQLTTLERHVQALSDRMEHDPKLANALHDLITSVTAIRATAGILLNEDRVDQDWQRRFHTNLHADSRRLTEQSKALMSYLDRAPEIGRSSRLSSPEDQVEAFLAQSPDLIAAIDQKPNTPVAKLLERFCPTDFGPLVRERLRIQLVQLTTDAQALPLEPFLKAAIAHEADPGRLAADFNVALPLVFRRLAYLPDEKMLPYRGLVVCDAAGTLTQIKAVRGFGISRQTERCPRWPLFQAFQQLGRPIRAVVEMPGALGSRFMCYGLASVTAATSFDSPPMIESTMLIVADPATEAKQAKPAQTDEDLCACAYCRTRR
ncbi:MAG: helix-turn-helix domain-containing protein [Pseudomonadota bacterium]